MRSCVLSILICSLAYAQDVKPIWIVQDEPPAPVIVGPLESSARVGAVAVVVGAAGMLAFSRRRRHDPLEAAYDRMSASFGLDGDDRAVIRELSVRSSGVAPVALLISESALQREIARARRRTIDPGRRARLNRVEARVLG